MADNAYLHVLPAAAYIRGKNMEPISNNEALTSNHQQGAYGANQPTMQGASAAGSAGAPLRVCIIYAYPSLTKGHGPKILQKVLDTLREAAVGYDLLDLYRERFNPVLSDEEIDKTDMAAWPDVVGHQSKLREAGTWIFLYPVWWSSAPAMLKGWLDRVLSLGFAYSNDGKKVVPLLSSKRALIVRTFGRSAAHEEKLGHAAQASMDKAVLGVCGVKSVAVDIYSVEDLAETAFNHALFGVQGAVRRVQVKPSLVPHHLRSISAPYLPPIEQKPRLPVDSEGEEKIELSDEAKSDLEYFKSARRKAREGVHQRADARQGGKPRNAAGQSRNRPEGSGGFSRGGDRFFGRKREGGRNFGSAGMSSNEEGGIFSSGRNSGQRAPNQPRGGGSFMGRPPQGGRPQQGARPPQGGRQKPQWSGGNQRRRRR